MAEKWQSLGAITARDGLVRDPLRSDSAAARLDGPAAPAPTRDSPLLLTTPRAMPSGLLAGTLVETATGWHGIETLQPGQQVQTLDGGLVALQRVDRHRVQPNGRASLIHLPGGCLDACSDLTLLPGQHLLVDTLDDRLLAGAPFVLVPALALLALDGPRRYRPETGFEVITLRFAEEEVVFAQSGVLFHCPALHAQADRAPEDSFFPRLGLERAATFLIRRKSRLG